MIFHESALWMKQSASPWLCAEMYPNIYVEIRRQPIEINCYQRNQQPHLYNNDAIHHICIQRIAGWIVH